MNDNSALNEQLVSLLSKCAESDDGALAELYHLTAAKLYAVQVRILGVNSMAERALHDTYARIWLKSPDYSRALGQPIPWMTSIARNHALNLRRALRDDTQAESGTDDDDTAQMSTPDYSDGTFLDNHASAQGLKNQLDNMEPSTCDSIVRAYLDGTSLNELSALYNIPVDSLHDSIQEGMQALRTTI